MSVYKCMGLHVFFRVTLRSNQLVCLNPEAPMGKQLIRCWKRWKVKTFSLSGFYKTKGYYNCVNHQSIMYQKINSAITFAHDQNNMQCFYYTKDRTIFKPSFLIGSWGVPPVFIFPVYHCQQYIICCQASSCPNKAHIEQFLDLSSTCFATCETKKNAI